MTTTHDDAGYPSSLAARLRSEARSTRPRFSDALHDRLMERIASDQMSRPSRDVGVLGRRPMRLSRFTMPIVAAAACVVVLTVLVRDRGPEVAPNGSVTMEPADEPGFDDLPALGIESLPLYDDIDAGMRAGAWMLASSLVEMPDWATLADFGAAAEPREGPRP